MFRLLSGILILLYGTSVTATEVSHEPGRCMLYANCGFYEENDPNHSKGELPCLDNREAVVLDKTSAHYKSLEKTCPNLIKPDGEPTAICCDPQQLNTLERQLTASVLVFNRCPSCVENFRGLYCQITCSPNQATFMNVTEIRNTTETEGAFTESIYISEAYATNVHTSCKDVIFPQTNGKAMALVCNGFSGDDCTPQRFLDYLGSTNNGIAPLNMDFQQIGNDTGPNSDAIQSPPEGMAPLDAFAYKCQDAPSPTEFACSCTDCEASCPAPPILQPDHVPFMIGTADGVAVIVLIIFLAFVVLFTAYLVFDFMFKNGNVKQKIDYMVAEAESKIPYTKAEDNGGRTLVTKIPFFQKVGKSTQDFISSVFRRWGSFVARNPMVVLISTILVCVALCVGVKFVILTTDPIELWSSAGSRVRQEKDYYDDKFGAFYRTEMIIMKLKPQYVTGFSEYTSFTGVKYNFSNILETKYILEMLALQNELRYMDVSYEVDGEVNIGTLNDICFIPLSPDNNNCTITSVMNYWQNDPNEIFKTANYTDKISEETYVVDYRDHFLYCVQAPATVQDTTPLQQNCMGDFGGPVFPYLALGGQGEGNGYNEAPSSILTFVVSNFDKEDNRTKLVTAWEKQFLRFMNNYTSEYFDFAYFSERSPEDELERSSQTDVVVFAVSYLVIFAYIAIALGTYTSLKRIPVDSKISLGVSGILVILASVFTSIGLFGYIGYATSLIVIEVVPFLVLAIGADNIFILTLEYQRDERKPDEDLADQIGRVMGEVGPSMLLCSLTECVAFFLGALTDMPAVEQFALAAAVAIAFDFLLQITAFLAVLSLDARRTRGNRVDVCCCIKMEPAEPNTKTYLETFFHKYYAPVLMNDLVRYVVMIGFVGLSCWCTILCTRITVGLDQDLSVPKDSYVLKYFDYMEKYLDVGVPVYFVTKGGYNFADKNASSLICGSAGCDTYSLTQQISYASQNASYWRIETPAASWYDDYVDWLPPQGLGGRKSCCRYETFHRNEFCPATDTVSKCSPCLTTEDYTPNDFMQYLPWFLIDNPGVECNKGGHSAYGNAVNIVNNYTGSGTDVVDASYFMAFHSVCIKSVDCTENLIKARKLADNITKTLKAANKNGNNILENEEDFEVFPYCLYYVYYEQYLTAVEDTLFQLGICLIPTFAFSFILLGFDFYSGIITVLTIVMIVVDTAGLCSLWGVDMNAVSLINLVAAIGLSVEFISHVVRTFSLKTHISKKKRVIESMATMGPAVFAGVALTNLPGIIVLNWATAQLIQIFFFRMCLVITLLGTAHGLIFLPVFLSYFGPPVNKAILYEEQSELRNATQNVYMNANKADQEKQSDKTTKNVHMNVKKADQEKQCDYTEF
ncbi:NPC1-like intracellular cholesterol transporter 1 isoform X1 [Ciona intestinalis]